MLPVKGALLFTLTCLALHAQVVTTGLIGRYAMTDASGSTLTDSSGSSNNGTLVGSPTIGTQGITLNGSTQYATFPAAIAGYKSVVVFADFTPANLVGSVRPLVGSSTASATQVLLANANDTLTSRILPSIETSAFQTQANQAPATVGMVTYVADASTDHFYLNGAEAGGYAVQNGNLAAIAGTIQLGGDTGNAGVTKFAGQIYYALFYNIELSAAQVLQNYTALNALVAARGVTIPSFPTTTANQLVYDGDSITFGTGLTPYPSLITTTIPYTVHNIGVPSFQLAYDAFGGGVDAYRAPQANFNVDVIFLGTNDICVAGTSAANTHTLLSNYATRQRSNGWKVVVVTMISRLSCATGKNILNPLIRANWRSYADAIADVAAAPFLGCDGCYLNSTYFQSDGIHPTQAGQALLAPVIQAAINTIGAGSSPLPQPPLGPISGATPRYQANVTTSGASLVTVQATPTSDGVAFEEADIYSALPCIATIYINGTPATATSVNVTGPIGVSSATPPAVFNGSNSTLGTALKSYEIQGGSTLVLDLKQFYFPPGAGGNVNLSIGTSTTATVQLQWIGVAP